MATWTAPLIEIRKYLNVSRVLDRKQSTLAAACFLFLMQSRVVERFLHADPPRPQNTVMSKLLQSKYDQTAKRKDLESGAWQALESSASVCETICGPH